MVDFSVSNLTSTDDVVFLNIKEIKNQVLLGHMPCLKFLRSQLSTVFCCLVWFGLCPRKGSYRAILLRCYSYRGISFGHIALVGHYFMPLPVF